MIAHTATPFQSPVERGKYYNAKVLFPTVLPRLAFQSPVERGKYYNIGAELALALDATVVSIPC